jgi:hypothetical protein
MIYMGRTTNIKAAIPTPFNNDTGGNTSEPVLTDLAPIR